VPVLMKRLACMDLVRKSGLGIYGVALQDTTEFSHERENADRVGQTCRINSGGDKEGRIRMHTVCGLLTHASLAVTPEGLPLGLGAVKFWIRNKFRGTNALKIASRWSDGGSVPEAERHVLQPAFVRPSGWYGRDAWLGRVAACLRGSR
jgi:hypothetical protein